VPPWKPYYYREEYIESERFKREFKPAKPHRPKDAERMWSKKVRVYVRKEPAPPPEPIPDYPDDLFDRKVIDEAEYDQFWEDFNKYRDKKGRENVTRLSDFPGLWRLQKK